MCLQLLFIGTTSYRGDDCAHSRWRRGPAWGIRCRKIKLGGPRKLGLFPSSLCYQMINSQGFCMIFMAFGTGMLHDACIPFPAKPFYGSHRLDESRTGPRHGAPRPALQVGSTPTCAEFVGASSVTTYGVRHGGGLGESGPRHVFVPRAKTARSDRPPTVVGRARRDLPSQAMQQLPVCWRPAPCRSTMALFEQRHAICVGMVSTKAWPIATNLWSMEQGAIPPPVSGCA